MFHNVGDGIKILIRTYLIIVIPIIVDLKPLTELHGTIDFRLENTIERLQSIVTKLQHLHSRRVIQGNSNERASQQLSNILSDLSL